MKNILGKEGQALLQRVLSANPFVALDYDGTLSPIVKIPEKATMRQKTRTLLSRLTGKYRCAVISGRALEDLEGRLNGLEFFAIAGNHGAEWKENPPMNTPAEIRAFRTLVRQWDRQLNQSLQHKGISVENKGLSVSVHISTERQAKLVLEKIKNLSGFRLIPGKSVFNILPSQAPNKGDAFRRLLKLSKCSAAIFIGDDDTDEDIFRETFEIPVVTIRVSKEIKSAAQFYITAQKNIDDLFATLLR